MKVEGVNALVERAESEFGPVGDPERWLGGMQRFQAEIERARAGLGG